MNDEEVTPEEKACRDSAHALRGGGELGQLCRPCAEDELIRLRSIVARLSKSALRVIKRPDGYWLFIEAGGLEAAIILRGPELNPFSIVDRAVGAAAIAEILPGSMQPRIQSVPEVVNAPARGTGKLSDPCLSCQIPAGTACPHLWDEALMKVPPILREHITDGPCWCEPAQDGAVSKHKI